MKQPKLHRLQEAFQMNLLQQDKAFHAEVILPPNDDTVAARMAIYEDGYVLRLQEALQEDFAGLYQWLGAERFSQITQAYIQAQPSNFYSLGEYGCGLERFLKEHPEYQSDEAMIEMVRFEWALSKAHMAADLPSLKLAALTSIVAERWSNLSFDFHPSVQWITLKTNVPKIWQAVNQSDAIPDLTLESDSVLWLVWRRALEIYFSPYNPKESYVLTLFKEGQTWGDVCEGLTQFFNDETEIANFIALFLQRLLAEQQLVCAHLNETV